MGDASTPPPETLLVVFPFEEPTALFDRLKAKFPYVKTVFYRLTYKTHPWDTGDVPEGMFDLRCCRFGFRGLFFLFCSLDGEVVYSWKVD